MSDLSPVGEALKAVEKKNCLFFGEANAGQRGAIIYTIIESCRAHGIDPYEYLRDVFTRFPNTTNHSGENLTPAAWALGAPRHRRSATRTVNVIAIRL